MSGGSTRGVARSFLTAPWTAAAVASGGRAARTGVCVSCLHGGGVVRRWLLWRATAAGAIDGAVRPKRFSRTAPRPISGRRLQSRSRRAPVALMPLWAQASDARREGPAHVQHAALGCRGQPLQRRTGLLPHPRRQPPDSNSGRCYGYGRQLRRQTLQLVSARHADPSRLALRTLPHRCSGGDGGGVGVECGMRPAAKQQAGLAAHVGHAACPL
jgi:hypothetical protein